MTGVQTCALPILASSKLENNWVTAIEKTNQFQAFTKFFDGLVVTIDNVEYAFVQIDVATSGRYS